MEKGEVFLAATRAEVRQAFFDHELIFSLGITAILNVPIRHAGRRLGTINLCGEEGMYGAGRDCPRQDTGRPAGAGATRVDGVRPLAATLRPTCERLRKGSDLVGP